MPVSNTLGKTWNDPTGTTLPPLDGLETPTTIEEDDKELVEDLKRIWDYEDKQRAFHERRWQRSLDRKNLIFDFSRKRPWQSRRVIPGYTILCLKVAWELSKPVALATGPLFEATTDLDPWRELLDIPTEILEDAIKSNGQSSSDLISAWFTAMETMADTGNAYMMVVPETEGQIDLRPTSEEEIFGEGGEELPTIADEPLPSLGLPSLTPDADEEGSPTIDELKKKPRIRFEALNPMDTFIDTANPKRPTFVMWRQYLMPWQFEEMAERHGWENVEEIIKAHKHSTSTQSNSQRLTARNNVENTPPKAVNHICVHFFVGTLPSDGGRARFKNKFSVWSGDHICQRPKDLGFKHGELPIIHGGMLERSFGAYGDSLAVINLDPQEARNEMMNSLLDYMNQVINPPTEIDHNQLHSAIGSKQLAHGLTPGGVIHAQKTNNGPVISRSQVPDMPAGMWQGLGYIDQRASETTGLSDIGSMPRTRNRISADEAAERQAMSGGIWQKCLLQIENKFLAPALNQAWLLGLQITTDSEWRARIRKRISKLEAAFPTPQPPEGADAEGEGEESSQINPNAPLLNKLKRMEKWDAKTRWKNMAAAFTFVPKVFSSVESRRRGLEQMQYLVDFSSAVPGMMQSVLWPKVSENVLLQLMLDPTEYMRPDAYDLPPPVDPNAQQMQPGMTPGAPVPVNPVVPPPPVRR